MVAQSDALRKLIFVTTNFWEKSLFEILARIHFCEKAYFRYFAKVKFSKFWHILFANIFLL